MKTHHYQDLTTLTKCGITVVDFDRWRGIGRGVNHNRGVVVKINNHLNAVDCIDCLLRLPKQVAAS